MVNDYLWEPLKTLLLMTLPLLKRLRAGRLNPSPFSIPIAIGREGYKEFLEVLLSYFTIPP
jgi:hypothetical protein